MNGLNIGKYNFQLNTNWHSFKIGADWEFSRTLFDLQIMIGFWSVYIYKCKGVTYD